MNDTSWTEGGITFQDAPPSAGDLVDMPHSTRDGTIGANVTGAVNDDPDRSLTFALSNPETTLHTYWSREGGHAPRLVLTVPCALSPDADGDGREDLCDCAPADATAFAAPGEITNLHWNDADTLAWDSAAAATGPGTRYDVMSGDLAEVSLFGTGPDDLCLAQGTTAAEAPDIAPPPSPGAGRFYLVRGRNPCGTGRWQTASDGRDRGTLTCP